MIRWNRTENSTNRIKDKDEWIVTEGQQPAIISKELFESSQERFKATYKPVGKRPSSTYKHWLSGLLKCPDCGRPVTPAKEEAYFFKMGKNILTSPATDTAKENAKSRTASAHWSLKRKFWPVSKKYWIPKILSMNCVNINPQSSLMSARL